MMCCGDGVWHEGFYKILSTYLKTLDTLELEVNDTVDSKDNLEEKTREVDGK